MDETFHSGYCFIHILLRKVAVECEHWRSCLKLKGPDCYEIDSKKKPETVRERGKLCNIKSSMVWGGICFDSVSHGPGWLAALLEWDPPSTLLNSSVLM